MKNSTSAIHGAPRGWAETLRRRALEPVPPHDLDSVLSLFREADFFRARIGGATDWAQVPPLEKPEVETIPVRDDGTLKETRTSGTTGYQVVIRNNRREREFRRELLYRPHLFYDLPDDVRQVVFVDGNWCATADMPPKRFEYGGSRYRTWFAGAGGDPGGIFELLSAIRPQLVRGIASAIVRFIDQSPAEVSRLRRIGVRIVAPGGEYLAADWRAKIADGFGAEVFDRYGATESGALAWQCPECGQYHANVDEIVIEDDPGGVLVTPLFVSSQPLLRYRLGDVIEFDPRPAPCSIRLPVMRIRRARRDDWIVGANGRRVSPLGFQFERVPHLTGWRLHQSADRTLAFYFESRHPDVTIANLREQLSAALPELPVEFVHGLWRCERPGKFKRVSSDAHARDA